MMLDFVVITFLKICQPSVDYLIADGFQNTAGVISART